jgi:hypothetical protein
MGEQKLRQKKSYGKRMGLLFNYAKGSRATAKIGTNFCSSGRERERSTLLMFKRDHIS